MRIRAVKATEAAFLSDLAFRSKGFWGYDQEFMEACRNELTITPQNIKSLPCYLITHEDKIIGFYALKLIDLEQVELEFLFIDPPFIGNGAGTRLFKHAVDKATSLGFKSLIIQGDPYAERFYRKMGGELIGEKPSASIPGRHLPLFEVQL